MIMKACCFFASNIDRDFPLERIFSELPSSLRQRINPLVRNGAGEEIVLDAPLPDFSVKGTDGLGGQSGNSARALGTLGVETFLSVGRGRAALRRFAGKNVRVIGPEGVPRIHAILEYGKGFLGAPNPNRIILTYDPENTKGTVPESFEKKVLAEGELSFALVGGLHLAGNCSRAISLAKKLRARGAFTHFEFNSKEGLDWRTLIGRTKGAFDSFGCNSEEAEKICGKDYWSLPEIAGAEIAVVHSRGKSVAVFRTGSLSPNEVSAALSFAAKLAAGKVFSGKDCSIRMLGSLEKAGKISAGGRAHVAERSGIVKVEVPSWTVSASEKTSLGLGDSFAAGFVYSLFSCVK
ncbi:MAG: ADP-dependent glucokinase/phosphofructokinase [archaeon]